MTGAFPGYASLVTSKLSKKNQRFFGLTAAHTVDCAIIPLRVCEPSMHVALVRKLALLGVNFLQAAVVLAQRVAFRLTSYPVSFDNQVIQRRRDLNNIRFRYYSRDPTVPHNHKTLYPL